MSDIPHTALQKIINHHLPACIDTSSKKKYHYICITGVKVEWDSKTVGKRLFVGHFPSDYGEATHHGPGKTLTELCRIMGRDLPRDTWNTQVGCAKTGSDIHHVGVQVEYVDISSPDTSVHTAVYQIGYTGKHMCERCGKQDKLLKCTRCKSAFYCGRECQKVDWVNHKPHCK